ncbi:hypothetical protein D3C76_396840 [compost metagenome]
MLGGFKILPDLKNVFKREEYNDKWFSMIIGVPIVLLMYAYWFLIIVPIRKMNKMIKHK